MEGDNELAESIISQRLRRLREEGEDEAKKLRFEPRPIVMPSAGMERRPVVLRPDVIVEKAAVVNDVGDIEVKPFKRHVVANANAGPFEHLLHRGWLRTQDEDEDVVERRKVAGLRYQSLIQGAQFSGLKAQVYEGKDGGKSGSATVANDHSIDCIKKLESLEKGIPPRILSVLIKVFREDIWIWEGKHGEKLQEQVDMVLCGLDCLASRLGYMTSTVAGDRWPKYLRAKPRTAKAK